MPLESIDTFNVGKTTPRLINATPVTQAKITNGGGGKLFYKTTENVSTSDTAIEVGGSVTTEGVVWIISETRSNVLVEHPLAAPRVVSSSPAAGFFAGNWNPVAATSGTDTTPAEKKLFVASLFLPVNKKIKGIGYLVGSVGGTNKVVAGLFDSNGNVVAKTSETTEGATVGTAAEIQEVNLTSEYQATGPGVYFIGVTMNGNTARLRSIPKNTAGQNILSGELTLAAKNVLAKITPPTEFAADKAPVSWVF